MFQTQINECPNILHVVSFSKPRCPVHAKEYKFPSPSKMFPAFSPSRPTAYPLFSTSHSAHLPCPAHKPPLLGRVAAPRAGFPLKFLQCRLSRIFLCGVDILPVIPVLGWNGLAADVDGAGPSSALAATIGEDVVRWGWDAASSTVI